jgi:hypothetical protein
VLGVVLALALGLGFVVDAKTTWDTMIETDSSRLRSGLN